MAEILLAEHQRYLACVGESSNLSLTQYMLQRLNSFHAAVRLDEDEGESLLIDTGAFHSLAGSEWWAAHLSRVKQHGLGHMIKDEPTSIVVTGVGKDSETCTSQLSAPGALEDGTMLRFKAPNIPNSTVPALMGMEALDEHNMAPLPWSNQLVKVPKGKEHEIKWPQGTTFIQCKRAKTGHLMLPIGHFNKAKQATKDNMMAFTSKSLSQQAPTSLLHQPSPLKPQVSTAAHAAGTVNPL